MKRITHTLALMFITVCSFANVINEENNIDYRNKLEKDIVSHIAQNDEVPSVLFKSPLDNAVKILKENNDFYDCEVKVKTDIDGTKVDLVVTLYDVSWVGCQTLKAAVALALVTM